MASLALMILSYIILPTLANDLALPCNNYTSSPPTVTLKNGTYLGIYSAEYDQDLFLGMRYAQPPVRFAQARPLNSTWTGTRNATAYSPDCLGFGPDSNGFPLSEDCLFINVVRPAGVDDTARLPVLAWIHGGGLVMGGARDPRYNLSYTVQNSVGLGTPIIGVSFNYRLSAFGFLGSKEAVSADATNIGFRDQRLALRWINENIAGFGGSPDLVTIWGESSGAESVSAQTFAYNGRDDKLFRGVIAQSGFGGNSFRYSGGYNNTAGPQAAYDGLVQNTSCASLISTPTSLACLRKLPLHNITPYLNASTVGTWAPVMDKDFIANWPSIQLREGLFPKIPILIGSDTDEGTLFSQLHLVEGRLVDSDADVAASVAQAIGEQAAQNLGERTQNIVGTILSLYPDIQAVGIPSLQEWPVVITPNNSYASTLGLQYRRDNAFWGDVHIHFLRRRANIGWSNYGVPSYSFRFDVVDKGSPAYIGVTHGSELAWTFYDINGIGYAVDPLVNKTADTREMHLAKTISDAWINFVVKGDPNGATGFGLRGNRTWPVYSTLAGGGIGQEIVFSVQEGNYLELDSFRAEGLQWLADVALPVLGN